MLFIPTFLYPCIWITHIRRRFNGRMKEKKNSSSKPNVRKVMEEKRREQAALISEFGTAKMLTWIHTHYTRIHTERKIEIGRESSSAFSFSVYRRRDEKKNAESYIHCCRTLLMPCSLPSPPSLLPLLLFLLLLLSVAVAVFRFAPSYVSIHTPWNMNF